MSEYDYGNDDGRMMSICGGNFDDLYGVSQEPLIG